MPFNPKSFIAACLLMSVPTLATTVWRTHETLGNNFTLAAFNNTLSNANFTGAPLVLGSADANTVPNVSEHNPGAIDGESFYLSSTYYSYPYNEYPSLGLVNGNLRAFDGGGNWHTNASVPFLGYEALSWATSTLYSDPAPTAFSAATIPASVYPVLAVNGVYDMWYLCPSDERLGQDSVYYNTTFIGSSKGSLSTRISCYSVTLNMVPVQ
ncbi:hypothetical protein DFH05DRAFT_1524681 [Lentinula detonsa]|uniref:Uncharacterized protein n=1 Tax=Lentinula detonsa TaxID=2804962 RepID=A0A9W8P1J2_9AGAR|nr:hypothetical protein DFH05DRAFT_1524681 [Lentinula detonsa]